jgi:hypothetical protein
MGHLFFCVSHRTISFRSGGWLCLYVPSVIPRFVSTCSAHRAWSLAIGIHSRKSGDVLRLSWSVAAYPCLIVCCGFPVGRAFGIQAATISFLGAH